MKKRTLFLFVLLPAGVVFMLVVVVIVAGIWFLSGNRGPDGEGGNEEQRWSFLSLGSKKKTVRVIEARRDVVVATISAPGVVAPARDVAITSRLAGRVMEIFADLGWSVEKGQIIAKLETEEFEIALQRAQSDFNVAQARLEEAIASLEQATVAAARSRTEVERKEALHGQGAFSDSEIDRARNLSDADRLRETVARKNLRAFEEAQRAARLAVDEVERDLAETEIRTPLTGIVTARNVNIGERVRLGVAGDPSSALFVVSDLSEILIYTNVDESDVSELEPDQPAKITTEALKDREFDGRTIDIAPRATRSGEISFFQTRILVEGDTEDLRPGMSAQVRIEVARVEDALVVPIEAVVERVQDSEEKEDEEEVARTWGKRKKREYVQIVFRVEEGKAKRCEVKTGISDETNIEILEGLEEGDQIVSGPYRVLDDLKDGDVLSVIKEKKKKSSQAEPPGEERSSEEPEEAAETRKE
ncbi:MAG: efflux RND transporter periplasmic adaptor subunit [Planctomycetota bacterium]|nr:efflux RND transporter periplasmic adaptor subunit [Planctomycetota bacterium]